VLGEPDIIDENLANETRRDGGAFVECKRERGKAGCFEPPMRANLANDAIAERLAAEDGKESPRFE